jgi:TP901 family phage tail tape measure protein
MASVIDVVLNLVDRVTNPLRTVQREMERTANMNRRLGRDIQKIGDGFSSVGESMLPIAAGITAIGVAGGHAFIDFDSIITGAAAKAGATADEMELMRQKASQFGADFPISATQAAEGMDRLAAAGYDANQVIGVMPSVITAAVASGEDLATTSDVVSNALNIWNLKQGDIEQNAMRVADVVQMAANKSSLGMADFGLAMQYAGAPAATLNVSIEQLATAMAIMKNNGIEASTIGTSLRSVFSRLSEPPKPAAEAIEALGLQVKDASGNFLGLQPIVEQLRGKILNLSNTEQVAYAKALAGEEAYSGLLALVKTAPEDYQALQDAMDSATGSSQAQFEVMKGTLKNSIDGMLGSLESLAINFGTVLTPQIKMITDSIGNFADMINKLSPETKLLIGNVLMGTVAFTGFMLGMGKAISIGGGLVKLYGDIGRAAMGGSIQNKALQFAVTHVVSSFNALKTAFVAVRSAMTLETVAIATASGLSKITSVIKTLITASRAFIFSPLGIALMAIAGIAFLIYQNWETVGPFLIGLWNQIKTALLGAWTQIQPAVTTLMASFARLREVISNAINTVLLALQPAFNAISQLINTVISLGGSVSGMLMPILQSLAVFLGSVFISGLVVVANVITNSIIMAINVATAVITGFLGVLNGVITFLTGVFTGNWGMAWQGIVQVFESIFSTITGVVEGVLSGVKASVNSIIDSINSVKFTVPDFVPGIGGKSFDGLNIPKFAGGTDNFAGGPAIINERGGEIVDLPSGTRVIPHDKSIQTAYAQGRKDNRNGGNNFNFNVNIYGASMKSDEDLDDLAEKLIQRFYYQMKKRSINMNEGAI